MYEHSVRRMWYVEVVNMCSNLAIRLRGLVCSLKTCPVSLVWRGFETRASPFCASFLHFAAFCVKYRITRNGFLPNWASLYDSSHKISGFDIAPAACCAKNHTRWFLAVHIRSPVYVLSYKREPSPHILQVRAFTARPANGTSTARPANARRRRAQHRLTMMVPTEGGKWRKCLPGRLSQALQHKVAPCHA